jgi:hypothetical protein
MSEKCKYPLSGGKQCLEDVFEDGYCILHVDIPEENDDNVEFMKINSLKTNKFKEKIDSGDYNFEGAILDEIILSHLKIQRDLIFRRVKIRKSVKLTDSDIEGYVDLSQSIINKDLYFLNLNINGSLALEKSEVFGDIEFDSNIRVLGRVALAKSKIHKNVYIHNSIIDKGIGFKGAQILNNLDISISEIKGSVIFNEVIIVGLINFLGTSFEKEVNFDDADIKNPRSQVVAFQTARKSYEELMRYDIADEYHFKEMVARRKQKSWFIRSLEYIFLEWLLKYWTDFKNVLITWFFFVFIFFSLSYWIFGAIIKSSDMVTTSNFLDCLYFSIVTATTLGYGDFLPVNTFFRLIAGFEAIFCTFLMIAFTTIVARKYTR